MKVDNNEYDEIKDNRLFSKQKMAGSEYQRFLDAYETDTPAIVNNGNIYVKKNRLQRNIQYMDQTDSGYQSQQFNQLPKKRKTITKRNWDTGDEELNSMFAIRKKNKKRLPIEIV